MFTLAAGTSIMSSAAVSAVATPRALKFNPRRVAGYISPGNVPFASAEDSISGARLKELATRDLRTLFAQSLPVKWNLGRVTRIRMG